MKSNNVVSLQGKAGSSPTPLFETRQSFLSAVNNFILFRGH